MRFLAFMLLLIGGASAGAAWQGYGWEDLRCSIEENRWGCEDETVVILSRPDADRDRVSCEEVAAAGPRDEAEGLWFLANCIEPEELARLVEGQEAAEQPSVEEDLPLLYGIGDRSWCEFYARTDFVPEGVPEWWDDACQGIELSDHLPTYCPFGPGKCAGMIQGVGLRATTDILAGTRFTPAVIEMVLIPYKAYGGTSAVPAWTLGALARTDIPAGEILLEIMLCSYEVGCPEVPQPETSPDCDDFRGSDPRAWVTGVWQWYAVNCFSCETSGSSNIPEERMWFEQNCLP